MKPSSQFNFLGDIHVQNMQRQSGIFIGEQNHAVGWSTHGKENSVIGRISGQSNLLYQCVSILHDPDFIDTPIDDRDINITVENSGDHDNSSLTMGSVNVNTMQPSSSVFVGNAHVAGIDAHQKSNYTQGHLFGNHNQLLHNVNTTHDEDVIDGIIEDQDIKISDVKSY
ncbi:hypothetical protein [Neobacillus sp. Marseille-QA0830]